MTELLNIDELTASIVRTVERCELEAIAHDTVIGFGFSGYTYHRYSPFTGTFVYSGDWNPEWVETYEKRGYADIDPVAERVVRVGLPFTWGEVLKDLPVNAPGRKVFAEAACFGLAAGADIPLHDPGLGGASFSVFSQHEAAFERAWQASSHRLHLFALHFHERHKILVPDEKATSPAVLTGRERECLSWLARGKTMWEIGQILGIAENTVRMHINACVRKMGASSRLHAVAVALVHRSILP
ncbi:hypothetical protein A6A04_19665 [Paramagnetospirillum marisnigri]|uniref:HTH luxR-type domain-containing protein n=1 Tax=Paramagnetospirillum marisnigri TaxID=1285242 RepID=A0A178MJL8_9PROT|nr:LuxR family transcriptional regulator [Paramagnetospirillum marisnigri]OAN48870.1 hypothetical protein A6A04_19665 [Paramagnetospirillum marisnigri]